MHFRVVGEHGQWISFGALAHCSGAVPIASPEMHCHISRALWVANFLVHGLTIEER